MGPNSMGFEQFKRDCALNNFDSFALSEFVNIQVKMSSECIYNRKVNILEKGWEGSIWFFEREEGLS